MEKAHKSTMQNHNTQLSHYTQICKQCLSEYKKKKPNPNYVCQHYTLSLIQR